MQKVLTEGIDVRVSKNYGDFPKVEVNAMVIMCKNGTIISVDTQKIQEAVEKAVAESVKFNEVQGDAHTAS